MTWRPMTWMLLGVLMGADTCGAAALPAPLSEVEPGLKPVGAATLHWFGLPIYDITLYAPESAYAPDHPAALNIRYHVSISHRRLLDTTLTEWRRMGTGEDAQRAQWIQQLEPLWPDLKPGDSLTAFMHRDGATQFYFGDRFLGAVPDPAFGPAFFAIWLDTKCRYPEVRDRLLGTKVNPQKGR